MMAILTSSGSIDPRRDCSLLKRTALGRQNDHGEKFRVMGERRRD
ncbi:hypothetical protein [Rhizobium leguminosarum]|nr:hypothetical protein [Rhizobium leguminosarum]